MKPLIPGDRAPRFETTTLDGTVASVPSTASWTLVSFLRYASCPMCNLRVRELTLETAELAAHRIEWVAVFHSPARRLERHMRAEARTHVVADPRRELYERYGVARSWRGLLISMIVPSFYWRFLRASAQGFWGGAVDDSIHTMPADFLVSSDGVIRLAHYGRHIGDHVHVTGIVAAANGE